MGKSFKKKKQIENRKEIKKILIKKKQRKLEK